MTLEKYLSNHSKHRNIDKVIVKWFARNFGAEFCEKSKEDWDTVIEQFFGEVESSPTKKVELKKNDFPVNPKPEERFSSQKKGDK
jgi:hypothetical protein